MGGNSFLRPFEGVGPESLDFFSCVSVRVAPVLYTVFFLVQADPLVADLTGACPKTLAHLNPQISDLFGQVLLIDSCHKAKTDTGEQSWGSVTYGTDPEPRIRTSDGSGCGSVRP